MTKKKLVEVAGRTEEGLTPLGIMNAEQAKELPDELDVVVLPAGTLGINEGGRSKAGHSDQKPPRG